MSALYPNVPVAPGVPPVLRNASNTITRALSIVRLTRDALNRPEEPRWGLYKAEGGDKALDPDSIVAVEQQAEWVVNDYPIEKGGFESYNKVTRPYLARVTMTKGGSTSDRTLFLQAVEALAASTDLVSVVTPERTYENGSVIRASYSRRSTEGAQLLVVEFQVQEIRQTAESAFTSSKEPASADAVNDGAVQAKPLPAGSTSFFDREAEGLGNGPI